MISGAAHDTMCVAPRVPSAMVFVPCKDGISHHPAEEASPEDAALAAEIILNAIVGDSRLANGLRRDLDAVAARRFAR